MSAWEAKKYLQYKLKAKDEHSIHSPFVFKLYLEAIRSKTKYPAFDELNELRAKLLRDKTSIEVTDLGAGSKKLRQKRTVSEIAKVSVIQKKYGELLFRLVSYFQPKSILELGTSLGLSTLYMAKAAPAATIISVEGCPNTHHFAESLISSDINFSPSRGDSPDSPRANGQRGPLLVNSSFEDAFNSAPLHQKFDLVYIDGNHTYEATTKYFTQLLDKTHNDTIMIFDDIYWSPGMTKAWEEIKDHKHVTVTIDLFKMGLVFFRKENKQKEHFRLRY